MKNNLLMFMTFCITTIGYAQFTIDNLTYYVIPTTNTVRINSYNGAGGAITIPATVTPGSTTYDVVQIDGVVFYNKQLTSVSIPNSVTSIGSIAFAQNQLTAITLPNNLTTMGNGAFQQNQLTDVTIPGSLAVIESGSFQANMITNITLENGITTIEDFAFYNNQLQSLTIPSSMQSMGNSVFQLNSLSNVISEATIPPSISTFSQDTFGANRNTIDLLIPASTTGAYVSDPGALWTGFQTVTENLQVGDTYVSNFITYEVTSTTNNTVKAIDYDVAGGLIVDIPSTITNGLINYDVTEVGDNAFQNKQLTAVTIPNSVITIAINAFQANQLSNLTIPNSVTSIGTNAFRNNLLTTVTIPNSVTNAGVEAFAENDLTSVTISENLTNLSANIFLNNTLTTVNIPNSITSIDLGAFQNNALTAVTIPANVTTIGIAAFINNQLTSVIIPENVTVIENQAFNGNPLTSITSLATTPPTIITGTNDSFSIDRSLIDLTIPAGTTAAYTAATWTGFNSVTEDLTVGDTYVSDFITYEVTSTTNNRVAAVDYNVAGGPVVDIPAAITNGLITYDVTAIGDNAFNSKNLTSVVLPNSVVSIGIQAFYSNNITSLSIPNSLESIDNNAFELNQITSIVIPNSVTFLDNGAFANNQLTSVVIPTSITTLKNGVFANNQLTGVTIPNNITIIETAAFINNQLASITIPSSVTNIGAYAFHNNSLVTVTSEGFIPPTIVTGTDDTFGDRSNTDLFIPAGTTGVYVTDLGALWTGFNSVTEVILNASDFEFENEITILTKSDTLEVIYPESAQLREYTLYNISGSKVLTGTHGEIATNSLSSAVYILKLDFDKGIVIKKVAIN